MYALARVVRIATAAVVVIIVAGILIHVLDANTSNAIVGAIDDAAKWLTQPFHGFFDPDRAKVRLALNWGLAAAVYGIAGVLLAKLMTRRVGGRMKWPWGRRRAVT